MYQKKDPLLYDRKKNLIVTIGAALFAAAFLLFLSIFDSKYIVITCIAIPAIIIYAVYAYLHEKKDDKKAAEKVFSILDGSYFDTAEWREKYIKYRMEHPLQKIKGKSMKSDLLARYRHGDDLLAGVVFFFFTGFLAWYMYKAPDWWQPIGIIMFFCLALFFMSDFTGAPVREFLKRDIDYPALERSYLGGRMMTYKKSGIVFGKTHIHIFTPKNVYAVDYRIAADITRKVVRVKQYEDSQYTKDRYDHYAVVRIRIPESGGSTTVEVQLDEFQVQIAIDEFHRIKHPDHLGIKAEYGTEQDNNVVV